MKNFLLVLLLIILAIMLLSIPYLDIEAQTVQQGAGLTSELIKILNEPIEEAQEVELVAAEPELIEIEATAYYDKYNRNCADGTKPRNGVLAGKRSWLGKSVELYDSNMNYMGIYTFHDVGYGKDAGWGTSKLLANRTVGTIEAGLCIDIYMETYDECINFGRKKVFMKWI